MTAYHQRVQAIPENLHIEIGLLGSYTVSPAKVTSVWKSLLLPNFRVYEVQEDYGKYCSFNVILNN
jgi:hypothetical protein